MAVRLCSPAIDIHKRAIGVEQAVGLYLQRQHNPDDPGKDGVRGSSCANHPWSTSFNQFSSTPSSSISSDMELVVPSGSVFAQYFDQARSIVDVDGLYHTKLLEVEQVVVVESVDDVRV